MEPSDEAIAQALRGEANALRRFGVTFRAPWWRRRIQARIAPRRYRLWVQREALRQVDDLNGEWGP